MKNAILDTIVKRSPHLSWIKDRTVYLTNYGSVAYGTNTPESDMDFRGICIPTKEYFLSPTKKFEQAELKAPDPDVNIYDLRKFFTLAMSANPSIIETLFTESEDWLYVDSIGEEILAHREEFLSKKVRFSFSGYAMGQLHQMKSHRGWLLNPIKSYPTREELGLPKSSIIPQNQLMAVQAEISKELDRFKLNFLEDMTEPEKIGLREIMSEMLAELKITTDQHWLSAARKLGLSDNFIYILQKEKEYANKKREYEQYQNWVKTRNPARAVLEEKIGYCAKNAYHLIRLLRMSKEILSTGKVIVKRPDREDFMEIRNGFWTYEDLIETAEQDSAIINELYKTCTILPEVPNKEKLDKLCVNLIEKSLSKYSWYNIQKRFGY